MLLLGLPLLAMAGLVFVEKYAAKRGWQPKTLIIICLAIYTSIPMSVHPPRLYFFPLCAVSCVEILFVRIFLWIACCANWLCDLFWRQFLHL